MFSLLKVLSVCVLLLTGLSNQAVSQTLAPETFDHPIAFEGENYTVNFTKQSFRGPLFDVVLETSDSESFVDFKHSETIRTYLGTVVGQPGSIAAGMIRADGEILARVTFADGTEWQDVDGTVTARGSAPSTFPSTVTIDSATLPGGILAADVLIDLPYRQFQASGGTPATALEMAEYAMACINTSFLRDAAVLNRIGYVIIRTDQDKNPYRAVDTTRKGLDKIRELHRDAITTEGSAYGGQHDLGLHADPGIGGGLAYIRVVSRSFGFSSNGANVNGDFTVVARHEVGHNWGSNHFEGGGVPEGRTIMSGNQLGKFSSGEAQTILDERIRRSATLDPVTNFTFDLPPRAFSDVIAVEVGSGPVAIQPLLNDHDSNGDALSITSFDPTTSKGESVSRNVETLTTTAPTDFSATADSFHYTLSDPGGAESRAEIFLQPFMAGDTLTHFTFDCSNTEVIDSSSFLADGSLEGNAFIKDGVLHVDGNGDAAVTSITEARQSESNTVTYAAMVYRDGDQNDWAGLIFQQSGDQPHGFNLGTNNELRYHWDTSYWRYNSGLIVPDRTWTFVALVITPTDATFYLDAGNGLQKSVTTRTHEPRELNRYHIGRSTHSSARAFKGMIDDARIIGRSLSEAEITDLAQDGLTASNPLPFNGSGTSDSTPTFEWTGSAIASAERFYLSSSYPALRDASPGDPADQGLVTGSTFTAGTLTPGQYYWRVDSTETGGRITRGHIWTLEISEDGLLAHYPLDDIVNTDETTCSCGTEHNATLFGTPRLSSDAIDGSSFAFNRSADSNGSLRVPAAVFSSISDQIALSFWTKGDATQGQNQIVNARDASNNRVLGIHLPWVDGKTYWDAGNADGFDRINANLPSALTANHWTHWVFQKNATSGEMEVYANGERVIDGQGHTRPFDSPITSFSLGRNTSGNLPWKGFVDDFRIYDRTLLPYDITQLYQEKSPFYDWIRSYFPGARASALKRYGTDSSDSLLLNYAARVSPDSTDTAHHPVVAGDEITYLRPSGGSGSNPYLIDDFSFTIEFSATLHEDSWSAGLATIEEILPRESLPNNTERIRLKLTDTTAPHMFYRLRVERP